MFPRRCNRSGHGRSALAHRGNTAAIRRIDRRPRYPCNHCPTYIVEALHEPAGRVEHRTPNIEHPTSNVEELGPLDVRCWMFDVGCSVLDVRCWMLGVRCSNRFRVPKRMRKQVAALHEPAPGTYPSSSSSFSSSSSVVHRSRFKDETGYGSGSQRGFLKS